MNLHSPCLTVAALLAVLMTSTAPAVAADVNAQRIIAADKEPGNWLSHGRTYSEQRFSPLTKITPENVGQLGLAWSLDIKSRTARGVEATPIVVDGVMYTTGAWSHVLAIDAKTGKQLWEFDPQIPGEHAAKGCCDVVNRGVAVWGARSTSAPSTAA
jgi:quinohemoprotein ethanol dehydrogenase